MTAIKRPDRKPRLQPRREQVLDAARAKGRAEGLVNAFMLLGVGVGMGLAAAISKTTKPVSAVDKKKE